MEYLMMVSLIVVVCLVGVGYFGEQTSALTRDAAIKISRSLSPSAGSGSGGTPVLVGSLDPPDDDETDGDGNPTGKSKGKKKSN